jgi:uncharacterized protein YndB with AHSA1/START domain
VIRLEQRIAAPVERVFRAWLDPRDLEVWAWASLSRDARAQVDPRVGGTFSVSTGGPGGETWSFTGTFAEIVPGRRLAYALAWQAPMGYDPVPETVAVDFAADGEGTALVFQHEGSFCERAAAEHAKGWADMLETLRRHVEGEPTP